MAKKIFSMSALLMGMVVCLSNPAFSASLIVKPGTLGDNYFSTIQAAVDAAAPGDTILISALPSNQAYNEQVIVNKSDIKIMGWFDTGSPKSAKNKASNNQCTVDANNLSAWVSRAEWWEDCCSPVILDGCDVESCKKTAMVIEAPNVTIEKLTIRHAEPGIRLDPGADNAIIENVCFFDCRDAIQGGDYAEKLQSVSISNCIFFGGESEAIDLYSDNAAVTKNRFRTTDDSIFIEGDNAVVDANILINCNDGSIRLRNADDALITNNWIEGSDDGIYLYLEEGDNPTIRNNTVKYTSDDGIRVYCGNCTGGVIENNRISFAFDDDEGMDIYGDNLTIQNNIIEYCAQDGLLYSGSNSLIKGNTVRFCGTESRTSEPGINIQGNNNLIEKNMVGQNSFDGIRNYSGNNNIYRENTLYQNGMSGICISWNSYSEIFSSDILIENNSIQSNHGEGINNGVGAVNTDIINNKLSGNKTDICNNGTIDEFSGNTFTTGGPDCNCVVR